MALAEVAGGAFCPLSRVTPTSTVCEPTIRSADASGYILVKTAIVRAEGDERIDAGRDGTRMAFGATRGVSDQRVLHGDSEDGLPGVEVLGIHSPASGRRSGGEDQCVPERQLVEN